MAQKKSGYYFEPAASSGFGILPVPNSMNLTIWSIDSDMPSNADLS